VLPLGVSTGIERRRAQIKMVIIMLMFWAALLAIIVLTGGFGGQGG
jgi:hypothetical protein